MSLPTTSIAEQVIEQAKGARNAASEMARAETATKNLALQEIADALQNAADFILSANQRDLDAAVTHGLDEAQIDRLRLTRDRIDAMANGVREVALLPDPVGAISGLEYRPTGIQVGRMRVPLGVIGIIYESRPNVTVDAAALCLKSGNACLLRGGSESFYSNQAIADCIHTGLLKADLPAASVQLIATTDRSAVGAMLKLDSLIDVIIPRGGRSLVERIVNESAIPVIKHLDGICHVYIDEDADIRKAIRIADNAKTHRYGVCNAMETLLVSEKIAPEVLPELATIYLAKGVEIRGCDQTCHLIESAVMATDKDWDTEYLAPILSIRIVSGIEAAIQHISRHGSGHTDAIVTESLVSARRFLREVDASTVMVNASTRFADGFEFGLGAEIGISTDKLHARGPVGLEGLTSQKYIVLGDGHIRK